MSTCEAPGPSVARLPGWDSQSPPVDSVLVVVPARNEASTAGRIVRDIRRCLPAATVVVVDDHSTDATAELARQAGALVLSLPVNLGYGGAVETGLKYAVRRRYGTVLLMDADGQHEAAQLPKLLEGLREVETDVVIGSRFLEDCGYQVSLVRRGGMRLFGAVAGLVMGQRVTDPTSGFQALSRPAVRFLAAGNYPVDFPDADVLIVLHRAGFRIREVPVVMHQRQFGESMTAHVRSLYYVYKMLISVVVAMLSKAPPSPAEREAIDP